MNNPKEQLDAIQDIRNLMERSSRYLPLSGIAGVFTGMVTITATTLLHRILNIPFSASGFQSFLEMDADVLAAQYGSQITLVLSSVFLISLAIEIILAIRNANTKKIQAWDPIAKRFIFNLFIPMATGGIFALILFAQNNISLILPSTLLFYGLGLINASKYSIDDIRYLGILEVATGLLACWLPSYGLLLWGFGFGVLHIVYGIVIYFKHEK